MLRSFPLLLLLPAIAVAQSPEVVKEVADLTLAGERTAQRNEDVEILRRLLNKACGLPNIAATWSVKQESPGLGIDLGSGKKLSGTTERTEALSPVGPFDGVYLPGAGVVFTLHVPAGVPTVTHGERIGLNSSCNGCHQTPAHPAVSTAVSLASCTACHSDVPKGEPAVSEWDQVKQAVRGEKSKAAEKPKGDKRKAAVCEPGNLQSLLAGVLAANAKHVRHLGEKEGVTVVVTFDELKPTARVWTGTSYYEPVEKVEDGKPVTKYELRTKEEWVDPNATPAEPLFSRKAFTDQEEKKLALGDLHLKQGKYKEACDSYGEALARFWQKPFRVSPLPTLTPELRKEFADELQKRVREAMKNYAKALLLADQPERAKEALEMATGFTVLEVTPTTVPATSTAPAKLIVSVTKADIDGAKDAAAFKKAVKMERVNFPK